MSISGYLTRRFLFLIPTLIGTTFVIFILLKIAPGDPVDLVAGPYASPQVREQIRAELGLDQPWPVQYARWLARAARGDLGKSIELRGRDVLEIILARFRNSLILAAGAGLLAVILGVGLGVVSALYQDSFLDRAFLSFSLFGLSLPAYWLATVMVYLFAVKFGLFPTGKMYSTTGTGGFGDLLWHLTLPALVGAVVPAALIARLARTAMLEVINQNFITVARAKGLKERTVLFQHALRTALPTISNMVGLQIGYLLLGSAVFVEIVFNWPGLGMQIFSAIRNRDLPMILGIVLFTAIVFLLINLLVDILHHILDPRVADYG